MGVQKILRECGNTFDLSLGLHIWVHPLKYGPLRRQVGDGALFKFERCILY